MWQEYSELAGSREEMQAGVDKRSSQPERILFVLQQTVRVQSRRLERSDLHLLRSLGCFVEADCRGQWWRQGDQQSQWKMQRVVRVVGTRRDKRAVDCFRLVATDGGPSQTTLAGSGFSLLEMTGKDLTHCLIQSPCLKSWQQLKISQYLARERGAQFQGRLHPFKRAERKTNQGQG